MKIITYRIDHDLKLIHEILKGEISAEEFMNLQKSIIKDPGHDGSYSILSDIRDSVYNFPEETATAIYSQMRELSKIYKAGCKCAFVTHKPMEVVRTYLYEKEMKNHSPIIYKTFSTVECAQLWLDIPTDVNLKLNPEEGKYMKHP